MQHPLSILAPSAYVQAFTARGVLLWREGESLKFRAPRGVLTPKVLASLASAKPAILPLLPEIPLKPHCKREILDSEDLLTSKVSEAAEPTTWLLRGFPPPTASRAAQAPERGASRPRRTDEDMPVLAECLPSAEQWQAWFASDRSSPPPGGWVGIALADCPGRYA